MNTPSLSFYGKLFVIHIMDVGVNDLKTYNTLTIILITRQVTLKVITNSNHAMSCGYGKKLFSLIIRHIMYAALGLNELYK